MFLGRWHHFYTDINECSTERVFLALQQFFSIEDAHIYSSILLAEDYPDYEDSPASENAASRETNSVGINDNNKGAPFFRVTAYTEKVNVGETVELKCEVKNAARKSEMMNDLNQAMPRG